jgi:hypothetical protein
MGICVIWVAIMNTDNQVIYMTTQPEYSIYNCCLFIRMLLMIDNDIEVKRVTIQPERPIYN